MNDTTSDMHDKMNMDNMQNPINHAMTFDEYKRSVDRVKEYLAVRDKFDVRWRKFTPVKRLGDAHGLVMLVRDDKGENSVIKWNRATYDFVNGGTPESIRCDFLSEAITQRELVNCPYVVRYFDHEVVYDEKNSMVNQILRIECVDTLLDDLTRRDYDADDIVKVGLDVSYGLDALRAIRKSHNDMIRQNVFLRHEAGGDRYLLADFGAVTSWDVRNDPDGGLHNGDLDMHMLGRVLYLIAICGGERHRWVTSELKSEHKPDYEPVCPPELMAALLNACGGFYNKTPLIYETPEALRNALKNAIAQINSRHGAKTVSQPGPIQLCSPARHMY